jgi:outer membrane usher protein
MQPTREKLPAWVLSAVFILSCTGEAGAANQTDQVSDDPALTFDNDFLSMSDGSAAKHINLNYFAQRGGMQPGEFPVQVWINNTVVSDNRSLTFKSHPDTPGKLYACISVALIKEWGVKPSSDKATDDCPIGGVAALIPWATERFDYEKSQLHISVPQAMWSPAAMMRTSPSLWDAGIPALLLNYNYSGNQQFAHGVTTGSQFLNLGGQFNLLGWRIHNALSWYQNHNEHGQWQSRNLYAQNDYAGLGGGQFTVGQTTSDGSVVDSVPFVGLRLASDSGMLDPSLTHFTPAISGIANSPATVTVRQYGKVIYQQNVPQGPFALTDFNRRGNGDVDVEVREADGTLRRFSMASASVPLLMPEGALGYSMSIGRVRDGGDGLRPEFAQANFSYGLGANVSLLTGVLASPDYQAVALGGGLYSVMLGAFSLTSTQSHSRLPDADEQWQRQAGLSTQLAWARNVGEVSLGFFTTRTSSPKYHSFSEVQSWAPESNLTQSARQRAAHQISLSRSLGEWGRLSLSGNQTTYWNDRPPQRSLTTSYSSAIHGVGVGISVGYSAESGNTGYRDSSMALSLSLPLAGNATGNYLYSRNNRQGSQQAGVSGSLIDNQVNYSVNQGWGQGNGGNASLGYSGRYGALRTGYSHQADNHALSYSMSGGLLAHEHGITLAQSLSMEGANTLVTLPGLAGVGVGVGEGKTDWLGNAVLSGLTPYDRNHVNIDVTNLPGNVELTNSSKSTVPSRGAVTRLRFAAASGYRVLFTLTDVNNGEIPFGAVVSQLSADPEATRHGGIVGDGGQTYLSGLPAEGALEVRWASGSDGQCRFNYVLPKQADMQRLQQMPAVCQ